MDPEKLNRIIQESLQGNWDAYRAAYPALSFADLQYLNDIWFRYFPAQNKYSLAQMEKIFSIIINRAKTIVELGCGTGFLALSMLSRFKGITAWTGYDISDVAISASVIPDGRYSARALKAWFYDTDIEECDAFVSTHTLEHMVKDEVIATLNHAAKKAHTIILELPSRRGLKDWKGDGSSHVLIMEHGEIGRLLSGLGYSTLYEKNAPRRWICCMTRQ